MFTTQIEFQGNDYLLIGTLENGGPIATREQYENLEIPFAYLFPNGDIVRYAKKLGSRDDITILKTKIDVKPLIIEELFGNRDEP